MPYLTCASQGLRILAIRHSVAVAKSTDPTHGRRNDDRKDAWATIEDIFV